MFSQLILIMSFVAVSMASNIVMATDECEIVSGYKRIYTEGSDTMSEFVNVAEPVVASTVGAPGCYQLAIQICRKLPASVEYEFIFDNLVPYQVKTPVYCSWEYNDGYLDDSNGYVTQYTIENNFYWLGDRRVYKPDPSVEKTP